MTAKRAANSISAPRIIWYTEAVTDSSPMFIRIVAIRSKNVGIASMKISLVLLPRTTGGSLSPFPCDQRQLSQSDVCAENMKSSDKHLMRIVLCAGKCTVHMSV